MANYPSAQDGYLDRGQWPPLNGQFDWTETSGVNRIMGQEGPGGLIFDIPVGTYTALTLVLSGTLPAIQASLDPTLLLYMVSGATPPLWSQSNLPAHEAGPLVSSLAITDSGLHVWTLQFDMGVAGPILALPGWAGRIALVVSLDSNIPARAFAASRHADISAHPYLTTTGGISSGGTGSGGGFQIWSGGAASSAVSAVGQGRYWRLQESGGRVQPRKFLSYTEAVRAARARNAATEGRGRR